MDTQFPQSYKRDFGITVARLQSLFWNKIELTVGIKRALGVNATATIKHLHLSSNLIFVFWQPKKDTNLWNIQKDCLLMVKCRLPFSAFHHHLSVVLYCRRFGVLKQHRLLLSQQCERGEWRGNANAGKRRSFALFPILRRFNEILVRSIDDQIKNFCFMFSTAILT